MKYPSAHTHTPHIPLVWTPLTSSICSSVSSRFFWFEKHGFSEYVLISFSIPATIMLKVTQWMSSPATELYWNTFLPTSIRLYWALLMDAVLLAFSVFLCFGNRVLQALNFEFYGLFSSVFGHQGFAVLLLLHSEHRSCISDCDGPSLTWSHGYMWTCHWHPLGQGYYRMFKWNPRTKWQLHNIIHNTIKY